ncbi:hypothetical protein D3C85_1050870 [compost metagenome]
MASQSVSIPGLPKRYIASAETKPAFGGNARKTSLPLEYRFNVSLRADSASKVEKAKFNLLRSKIASLKYRITSTCDEDSIISNRTKSCAIRSLRLSSRFLEEKIRRSSTTSSDSYSLAESPDRRPESFDRNLIVPATEVSTFSRSGL